MAKIRSIQVGRPDYFSLIGVGELYASYDNVAYFILNHYLFRVLIKIEHVSLVSKRKYIKKQPLIKFKQQKNYLINYYYYL